VVETALYWLGQLAIFVIGGAILTKIFLPPAHVIRAKRKKLLEHMVRQHTLTRIHLELYEGHPEISKGLAELDKMDARNRKHLAKIRAAEAKQNS
jgi:hypothetical protein